VLDGNPWLHYAADTAVLLVVGSALERAVGALRWAVLFAAGAAVGQLFGYAWDPDGAGASVGICGLIGGLVVVQLAGRRLHLVASLFCVGLVGALAAVAVVTSLGRHGAIAGIVVVLVCAVLVNVLVVRRRAADPAVALWYTGGVVAVGAIVLLALRDIHGAALLAGLGAGVLLFGSRAGGQWRARLGAAS
jgi:hypothetical protein